MSDAKLFSHEDKTVLPQDPFPFEKKPILLGVGIDGETIGKYDLAQHCKNSYFILFFFPMDFTCDSSEVLAFRDKLHLFNENHTHVIGVTHDSPYVIRHWMKKEASKGGFGKPVGFPILSDKDCGLAQALGVAQCSGLPCRTTFIVDWRGNIRFMMAHHTNIGQSVTQMLRVCQAYRHSDLTGEITPAGWQKGGEVIPADYSAKIAYYENKYGGKNAGIVSKKEMKFNSETDATTNMSGPTQVNRTSAPAHSARSNMSEHPPVPQKAASLHSPRSYVTGHPPGPKNAASVHSARSDVTGHPPGPKNAASVHSARSDVTGHPPGPKNAASVHSARSDVAGHPPGPKNAASVHSARSDVTGHPLGTHSSGHESPAKTKLPANSNGTSDTKTSLSHRSNLYENKAMHSARTK